MLIRSLTVYAAACRYRMRAPFPSGSYALTVRLIYCVGQLFALRVCIYTGLYIFIYGFVYIYIRGSYIPSSSQNGLHFTVEFVRMYLRAYVRLYIHSYVFVLSSCLCSSYMNMTGNSIMSCHPFSLVQTLSKS